VVSFSPTTTVVQLLQTIRSVKGCIPEIADALFDHP
ncbi:Prolamin_like domain-containing protein, partial [Psidium guajava]